MFLHFDGLRVPFRQVLIHVIGNLVEALIPALIMFLDSLIEAIDELIEALILPPIMFL